MTSRAIGIQIEGLGLDTAKSGGVVLCERLDLPTSATYEWVNALVGNPGNLTSRIDPFAGTWSSSSLAVRIDASDRLAPLLLATARDAYYTTTGTLSAASTTVNLTTTLLPPGDATIGAGQVIYVGDEAILLGTAAGGGSYTGCVRGYWSTTPQAHPAGSAVSIRQPYLYRRVVRVIHRTPAGVESVIWTGLLDGVRQEGPHVVVSVVSQLAALLRARVNLTASNRAPDARLDDRGNITWPADPSRAVTPGASRAYWQLGDDYLLQTSEAATSGALVSANRILLSPTDDLYYIYPTSLEDTDRIYRVLLIDRDAGEASTADLTYPYHPLAIAMALLMSTGTGDNGAYDVLGAEWGLGLSYVDVTAWEAAIDATPDLALDRLLLGRDGEPVVVERVIREQLLRPYGFAMTEDADGLLSVARLSTPDMTIRSTALANAVSAYPEPQPTQDSQLASRSRVLTLKVGGEPWGEPQDVQIELADRSTRSGRLEDTPRLTLDLSTIKPSRLIGPRGLTEYAQAIVQGLALGLDAPPVLKIRCASRLDTGLNIYPGAWVSVEDLGVEHAWWVTRAGERIVLDSTTVKGTGLCVGVSQPVHAAHMDLELLMLGDGLPDYTHLVAPAARVAAWTPGTQIITVDNAEFDRDGDAAQFRTGDQLSLWSSAGVRQDTGTPPTITNIAGDDITIDAAFVGATPTDGDLIRLARSDEYSNTAHYAGVFRPWTYLADQTTQTFDGPGSGQYDVYGTQFFIGSAAPTAKGSEAAYTTIDEDAIDADSGTTAWPLDAYVEQTLADNEGWLLLRDVPVTQQLDTHHGDDLASYLQIRPFCGTREMSIAVVPVLLPVGWAGAQASMIVRVANEAGFSADYEVAIGLDLYDLSWRRIRRGDAVTVSDTTATTPEWQPVEVPLALTAPIEQTTAGYLVLRISSQASALPDEPEAEAGSGAAGTDIFEQGPGIIVPSSSTFLNDTGATRPNPDDFAVSAFAATAWGANGSYIVDDYRDPLWRRNNGDEVFLALGPQPYNTTFVDQLARYTLTYAQVRSIEWSVYHADLGRPPQQYLEPGAPTLGEVAGSHLARLARVEQTPRLCAVGPRGDVDDPYSGAPGYSQRWPRERHDNATPTQIGLDFVVLPARLDPELILLLGVVPTHCVHNLTDQPPDDPLDPDWASVATWDVQVDVYEFDATLGWVVQTTVVQEITCQHRYTHAWQQGVLTSELAHWSGNFPYREGSMYAKDLPYVQTQVISIGSIDYNPATQDELIRLRVTLDGTGTPTYTERTNIAYRTRDRLQLAVCAASVYEVP